MTTSIVAVHGIGHYQDIAAPDAEAALTGALRLALAEGLARHRPGHDEVQLWAAYYAHLLHDSGQQGEGDELTEEEQAFLNDWMIGYGIPVEVSQSWAGVPVRLMADWVAKQLGKTDDEHFARRVARFLINLARDAARYLHRPQMRLAVREKVTGLIEEHRPNVVIGHSLGSVVVYEALWARPDLLVDTLITVGSPLALPGAIFDHLEPRPQPNARVGRGGKPPQVGTWINIADHSDLIAIPRPLHERFDGLSPENDVATNIGQLAIHGFSAYLRNERTVQALP